MGTHPNTHAGDPGASIAAIQSELESALRGIRNAQAEVRASMRRAGIQLQAAREAERRWQDRAALAAAHGRDALAREALREKRRYLKARAALESEQARLDSASASLEAESHEITQALRAMTERRRMLVERHRGAVHHLRVQHHIRWAETSGHLDLDPVNASAAQERRPGRPTALCALEELEQSVAIDQELAMMKARRRGSTPVPL